MKATRFCGGYVDITSDGERAVLHAEPGGWTINQLRSCIDACEGAIRELQENVSRSAAHTLAEHEKEATP